MITKKRSSLPTLSQPEILVPTAYLLSKVLPWLVHMLGSPDNEVCINYACNQQAMGVFLPTEEGALFIGTTDYTPKEGTSIHQICPPKHLFQKALNEAGTFKVGDQNALLSFTASFFHLVKDSFLPEHLALLLKKGIITKEESCLPETVYKAFVQGKMPHISLDRVHCATSEDIQFNLGPGNVMQCGSTYDLILGALTQIKPLLDDPFKLIGNQVGISGELVEKIQSGTHTKLFNNEELNTIIQAAFRLTNTVPVSHLNKEAVFEGIYSGKLGTGTKTGAPSGNFQTAKIPFTDIALIIHNLPEMARNISTLLAPLMLIALAARVNPDITKNETKTMSYYLSMAMGGNLASPGGTLQKLLVDLTVATGFLALAKTGQLAVDTLTTLNQAAWTRTILSLNQAHNTALSPLIKDDQERAEFIYQLVNTDLSDNAISPRIFCPKNREYDPKQKGFIKQLNQLKTMLASNANDTLKKEHSNQFFQEYLPYKDSPSPTKSPRRKPRKSSSSSSFGSPTRWDSRSSKKPVKSPTLAERLNPVLPHLAFFSAGLILELTYQYFLATQQLGETSDV